MAGEAVDADCRLHMTGLAEVTRVLERDRRACGIAHRVAGDAVFQSRLLVADAVMHRHAAFVSQKIRMRAPHHCLRGQTLALCHSLCCRLSYRCGLCRRGKCRRHIRLRLHLAEARREQCLRPRRHDGNEPDPAGQPANHSPRPILM